MSMNLHNMVHHCLTNHIIIPRLLIKIIMAKLSNMFWNWKMSIINYPMYAREIAKGFESFHYCFHPITSCPWNHKLHKLQWQFQGLPGRQSIKMISLLFKPDCGPVYAIRILFQVDLVQDHHPICLWWEVRTRNWSRLLLQFLFMWVWFSRL